MTRSERFAQAAVRLAGDVGVVVTASEHHHYDATTAKSRPWFQVGIHGPGLGANGCVAFSGDSVAEVLTLVRAWVAEHGRRAA